MSSTKAPNRGGKAVAQARGANSNRKATIIGVLIVALLAAVVVGFVVYSSKQRDSAATAAIPVVSTGMTGVPVAFDEPTGTVVVGKDTAPKTVDVYEDFLCPVCGKFESTYGSQIQDGLTSGKLKVRYHVLNLLDKQSTPAGYSLQSANAALAVAKNNPAKFPDFHASLFGAQPREGGPGYTTDQLVGLGQSLSIGGSYEQDVRGGTFDNTVKAAFQKASTDPALQRTDAGQSYFGTPTVAADGKLLDNNNPNWLKDLIG
jgi:protein-disulfide isomerase